MLGVKMFSLGRKHYVATSGNASEEYTGMYIKATEVLTVSHLLPIFYLAF